MKRNPKVVALPPTSVNLLQHILRAHLQVMLWKASDCVDLPGESRDIQNFGREFRNENSIPVIVEG